MAPLRCSSFPSPLPCTPLHLASASMWASVVNGGYSVEQTMVVEWPLVHWSHAGCYGQQHGWFYVNDDDDDDDAVYASSI